MFCVPSSRAGPTSSCCCRRAFGRPSYGDRPHPPHPPPPPHPLPHRFPHPPRRPGGCGCPCGGACSCSSCTWSCWRGKQKIHISLEILKCCFVRAMYSRSQFLICKMNYKVYLIYKGTHCLLPEKTTKIADNKFRESGKNFARQRAGLEKV